MRIKMNSFNSAYDLAFDFTNQLAGEGLSIKFVNRDRRDDLGCVRLKGQVSSSAFRVEFDEDGDCSFRFQSANELTSSFIDAVLAREQPVSNLHSAARSDIICHLCDITARTGRKITWDPDKEAIVGDEEAAKRMSRPMRAPWTL